MGFGLFIRTNADGKHRLPSAVVRLGLSETEFGEMVAAVGQPDTIKFELVSHLTRF